MIYSIGQNLVYMLVRFKLEHDKYCEEMSTYFSKKGDDAVWQKVPILESRIANTLY